MGGTGRLSPPPPFLWSRTTVKRLVFALTRCRGLPDFGRFLNSGAWMGYAKNARELLRAVIAEGGAGFSKLNDQVRGAFEYPKKSPPAAGSECWLGSCQG
jgi:hypothetical protein